MKIYLLQPPPQSSNGAQIVLLILLLSFVYFLFKKFKDQKGWWFPKICPKCKNKINSNATICQYCHSQLD